MNKIAAPMKQQTTEYNLRAPLHCKQCGIEIIPQNIIAGAIMAARRHLIICDDCRSGKKKWSKSAYAFYLQTEHWQQTRQKTLERGANKCALCSSQTRLEVHHNSYENLGGELPTDLVVLCHYCHKKHHFEL